MEHVNESYWDWFHKEEYLRANSNKIIAVLYQNKLNEDFKQFIKYLGKNNLSLPDDDVMANMNLHHYDTQLSK